MCTSLSPLALPPTYDHIHISSDNIVSPIYSRLPPPYSRHRRQPSRRAPECLPDAEYKEFSFDLRNAKGDAIATLITVGDRNISKNAPVYVQGSDITGVVKLTPEVGTAMKTVDLTVRGYVLAGGDTPRVYTFLDKSVTIWDESETPVVSADLEKPFVISLPLHAHFKGQSEKKSPLPHTFSNPSGKILIQYELILRITRKVLHRDWKLRIPIGYFQNTRPPPSSPLRQLSSQMNSPPCGPETDPEGWQRLPTFVVSGTVFSQRQVEITCSAYLAKPLSYTRGSTIPITITLQSEDVQALDLLSCPKSIVVRLQRSVKYALTEFGTDMSGARIKLELSPIEIASWSSVSGQRAKRRTLMGEIPLRKDLNPSSTLSSFSVEYHVAFYPSTSVGFKASDPVTSALLSETVEIVTNYDVEPPQYYSTDSHNHCRLNTRAPSCIFGRR